MMAGFPWEKVSGQAVLAPMAGITDSPFRRLCRKYGAALVYTEMLSAEGLARGHGKTWRMAVFSQEERPLALQLFGKRPEAFAEAARRVAELEPDFLDLNFGCPAPKVVKSGGGSALLREPKTIAAIARATVKASDRPVLAKIRSGWEVGAENAVEVARMLEDCGIAAIAVHGRTRSQMFSGRADWQVIAQVKQAVSIPVMGNGDVKNGTDAVRLRQETGCDLVMVGRAALGAPWIFKQIGQALADSSTCEAEMPWACKLEIIREHLDLMIAAKGEEKGVLEMRKHLGWYIKGLPGAARARQELMRAVRKEEVKEILSSLTCASEAIL